MNMMNIKSPLPTPPRIYALDSKALKAEMELIAIADEYVWHHSPRSSSIKVITGNRIDDGRPVTIIKGRGMGHHLFVLPTDD